jgi:hypothetical protein
LERIRRAEGERIGTTVVYVLLLLPIIDTLYHIVVGIITSLLASDAKQSSQSHEKSLPPAQSIETDYLCRRRVLADDPPAATVVISLGIPAGLELGRLGRAAQ